MKTEIHLIKSSLQDLMAKQIGILIILPKQQDNS